VLYWTYLNATGCLTLRIQGFVSLTEVVQWLLVSAWNRKVRRVYAVPWYQTPEFYRKKRLYKICISAAYTRMWIVMVVTRALPLGMWRRVGFLESGPAQSTRRTRRTTVAAKFWGINQEVGIKYLPIPQQRWSHLHRGRNLKSHKVLRTSFANMTRRSSS
jgi:hypothetical protein